MTAGTQKAGPVDLTVTLTEEPGGGEHIFRLVADGGRPVDGSNLPDPEAALEALERFGDDIFFPKPGPPRLCTQQYGGPQVAVVTGTFRGRPVNAAFRRTDGCEIARWKAMAPLLGGTRGSRGET